ncbi:MAG: DegV family protein [Anaerolineae bacterium]
MVKIVGDTTSCLSESFAQEHDIPIIPQVIIFGDESYLEGIEIDYATFMDKLRAATESPKTAAPPPELFADVFEQLAPTGEAVVCILPSAILSGTVRSAIVGLQQAHEERGVEELDVRIIDTQLIASPVATMIRLAAEWADQGVNADEIERRVRDMSARCKIYFLVDTLKYLAMGGRIGGASALLGSVLKIKPVLTLRDGQVDTLEKVRTHRRAVDRLKQLVGEQIAPGEAGHLSIMHADAAEEAQELVAYFQAALDLDAVPKYEVPPAVVTHGGPGVLGVGFFTEDAT